MRYPTYPGPLSTLGQSLSTLGQAWLMAQKSPAEMEIERLKQRYYEGQALRAAADAATRQAQIEARNALAGAVGAAFGGGPVVSQQDLASRFANVLPHVIKAYDEPAAVGSLARVLGAVTPNEEVARAASLAGGGSAPGMNSAFTVAGQRDVMARNFAHDRALEAMRQQGALEREKFIRALDSEAKAEGRGKGSLSDEFMWMFFKALGVPEDQIPTDPRFGVDEARLLADLYKAKIRNEGSGDAKAEGRDKGSLSDEFVWTFFRALGVPEDQIPTDLNFGLDEAKLLADLYKERGRNERSSDRIDLARERTKVTEELRREQNDIARARLDLLAKRSGMQLDNKAATDAIYAIEKQFGDALPPDVKAEVAAYALREYGAINHETLRRSLYAVAELSDGWFSAPSYALRNGALPKQIVDMQFGGPYAPRGVAPGATAPTAAPANLARGAPASSPSPPVGGPAQLEEPPADPAARKAGQVYNVRGIPMRWTGSGWVPAT